MCATVGFFLRRKMDEDEDEDVDVDCEGVGTAGFDGSFLVVVAVKVARLLSDAIGSWLVSWMCGC